MNKITRNRSTGNYTVLHNTVLQDENLSWQAKGLHSYLMQLPDDWNVVAEDLYKRSMNGRHSTDSAIKELIEAGYIVRDATRAKGKFQGYNYTVHETPLQVSRSGSPAAVNQQLVITKEVNTNTVQSQKPPSDEKESRITEEHKDLAFFLSEIVLLRRKKTLSKKLITNWANSIRLLIEIDGVPIDRVRPALEWYEKNWDTEYTPVIESGKSLREKFDKLLNAIDRAGGTVQAIDCKICDYRLRGRCKGGKDECKSFTKGNA